MVATKTILMTQGTDEFRLDSVQHLRYARREDVQGSVRAVSALDFDVFNLFNKATVLGKQYNARVTTYNQVLEIR